MARRSQRPPSKAQQTLPAFDITSTVSRAVEQADRSPHRPVLIVISGQEVGTRRPVDTNLVIGRESDVDLILTDALVSSRHALLEDRGDSWTLIDLGSTNGTTVNGEKGNEFALKHGDKIVFGATVVRFEMQDRLAHAYAEHVEKLLNVDELSGLLVRRKFDLDLKAALDAASAGSSPVGLLMMDLDGIKAINDTHGHLFGAYVIGESGKVIGRVLDKRGFASRFGGDEFIAALPGSALEAATAIGEEIRAAIAVFAFERESVALRPGISIGAAAFPVSATNAEGLVQRADEALYRAKRAGKNRVSS